MPPIFAAAGAIVGAVAGVIAGAQAAVAGVVFAVTGSLATTVGVMTLANRALLAAALGAVGSALAPKPKAGFRGDNQKPVTDPNAPRGGILGEYVTAGSLATWQAWGANNEYIILLFAVADHKCHSLTGLWWNNQACTINGDGSVQEAYRNGKHHLWVTFYNGDWNQAADSELITQSGGRWTANDRGRGVAYVKVKARYNQKVHEQGLSGLFSLLFKIKGAFAYDRRLDTSVGGSGAQRFNDQSTWGHTDNAAVLTENVLRGLRVEDTSAPVGSRASDTWFGVGLTDADLPFAENVSAMNSDDEDVALKAGGTEKRYRASGVFYADEPPRGAIENLLAAQAGRLITGPGRWIIRPGVARSVERSFIDSDFRIDGPTTLRDFTPLGEIVNCVTGRFSDPAQQYKPNPLPPRLNPTYETEDGGRKTETWDLPFVTSQTQGQRCLKIFLERHRHQKTARRTLTPENLDLEALDWIGWQSDRGGWDLDFEIEKIHPRLAEDEFLQVVADLRETSAASYGWNPAVDELDPSTSTAFSHGTVGAAAVAGITVTPTTSAAGGEIKPALLIGWTEVTDPVAIGARIEYRKVGTTVAFSRDVSIDPTTSATQETLVDQGVVGTANYEARGAVLYAPWKEPVFSGWTAAGAATDGTAAGTASEVPWGGVTDDGGRPADYATVGARAGTNLFRDDGSTVLTQADVRTIEGVASGITGQAATATSSDFAVVTGATRPSPNAGTSGVLTALGSYSTVVGNSVQKAGGSTTFQGGAVGAPQVGSCFISSSLLSAEAGGGLITVLVLDDDGTTFGSPDPLFNANYTASGAGSGSLVLYYQGNPVAAASSIPSVTLASRMVLAYDGALVFVEIDGIRYVSKPVAAGLRLWPKVLDLYNTAGTAAPSAIIDIQYGAWNEATRVTDLWNTAATAQYGQAAIVTLEGTAAAITGQAATATSSDFAVVTGATKPANNATVGAVSGTNLFRTDGSTVLTQAEVRTIEGVASSVTGQTVWATSGRAIASIANLSDAGVFNDLANVTTRPLSALTGRTADNLTFVSGGATVESLKPGEAGANVTETRTAAAIAGQAATATSSDFAAVTGATKPANNATVGARAGTNLFRDDGSTVLTQADVRTIEGVASGITGQAATATSSDFAVVTGVTRPSPNAGTSGVLTALGSYSTVVGNSVQKAGGSTAFQGGAVGAPQVGSCFISSSLLSAEAGGGLITILALDDDGTTFGSPDPLFNANYTASAAGSGSLEMYYQGNLVAAASSIPSVTLASRMVLAYDGALVFVEIDGIRYVSKPMAAGLRLWPKVLDLYNTVGTAAPSAIIDIQYGAWNEATRVTDLWNTAATAQYGQAAIVTLEGTAAAITGQAATATSSDFAVVTGATKPADNATVGARAGTNLFRTDGTTVLTQAEVRTLEGTAAAITGQTAWATATVPVGLTPTLLADRTQKLDNTTGALDALTSVTTRPLSALTGRTADYLTFVAGGATVESLKPGEAGANVTETRTAAAITGQAATATSSDFAVVTGATKPANNATVGAVSGTNLFRTDGSTVLTQAEVRTAEGTAAAISGQTGWATYATHAPADVAPRVAAGLDSSGDVSRDVKTNKVVTDSISTGAVQRISADQTVGTGANCVNRSGAADPSGRALVKTYNFTVDTTGKLTIFFLSQIEVKSGNRMYFYLKVTSVASPTWTTDNVMTNADLTWQLEVEASSQRRLPSIAKKVFASGLTAGSHTVEVYWNDGGSGTHSHECNDPLFEITEHKKAA